MRKDKIKGKHGYEVNVDKTLQEVNTGNYDILILPGGRAPEAIYGKKRLHLRS